MPLVLTFRQSLDRRRRLKLILARFLETAEAIQRAAIVEEAEAYAELVLAQLRQALPNVLIDDIPLTMLRRLMLID